MSFDAPGILSFPYTSLLRTLWRAPDYRVSPHQYGAYLSKNSVHPLKCVPRQDAYLALMALYVTARFRLPMSKPVEPIYLTKKRAKGKIVKVSPILATRAGKEARLAAPRGLSVAICKRQCDG